MSGNWFRLFRVVNAVKLYHCFGHWLCKKLELRSVGLLLNNQLCWAEICLWKFCCRLHLLPVLLSVVLILLSLLLLLSEAAASRKLCRVNLSYLLPDIEVAQFSLERNFSKKCCFQIISDVQWWTKKNHPFLHSTYQEWRSFVRIGDGPCYYLWNKIYAGVSGLTIGKTILQEDFYKKGK